MSDDLTDRITEALDESPVHSFRKPIPGGWTCIYCGEASAKGPAGLPVLSGQPCRYAPGMGTIARSLLAEARDEITRLTERLQDSWYVDIGERLDAAVAENTRLREGIERHRSSWQRPEIVGGDSLDAMDPHGFDRALWALLDAPSTASPVRDGTNTEREQQ